MEMLKELFMTTVYVCGIVFFITLTGFFIQSMFVSIRQIAIGEIQLQILQKLASEIEE